MIRPGSYITDDQRLYEVLDISVGRVLLKDCASSDLRRPKFTEILTAPWRSVTPEQSQAAAA